ncbi:hypothetical protein B7494_g5142 [Chlorociboria aeruginascens]|nr:hypothetical protein B7494_g5142 [Chlorociboria aeruginascens]
MESSLASRNPAFSAKISQMALPLAPLVQLTTGSIHPVFPSTVLNFWLLTSTQLDELAHFYHQRTPGYWKRHYPCPVEWSADLTLEEKRRKIGRFIGLRDCETPIKEVTEEEILERARAARDEAESELWKRKGMWY